jgi:hypothetical protein
MPRPQYVIQSRPIPSLKETNDKAQTQQCTIGLSSCQRKGEDRPADILKGDPYMSRHACENDIRRQLSNNISNGLRDDDPIVFVTVETKILFHTGDEGVCDVGRIDLLDQHAQSPEGQQRSV